MTFTQMTWGVKESFRNYVEAAEGTITLSDGATRADNGAFIFPAQAGGNLTINADGSASGSMSFQGTVTFEAHGGMLKSTLAELMLESTDDGLVLSVLEGPMNKSRCAVAELGPVAVGTDDEITLGTKITMDGMYQIADNYPPGTELDPVGLK